MKIIIILMIIMLQTPLAVMANSETPSFLEKDAENELAAIAPNDFNATLNYSYEKIDRHALNAPYSAEASVESLSAYLVKPAKNDREKARAIFRWITENIDYNVEVFFTGSNGATSSTDVLKSRKSVCYGYSDLFLSLAKEAGLEAVRIKGYGKGYGYMPGKNFRGPANHAWNAVKINGSWYLIDTTWGAGYVNGDKKYVRRFDDHFFLTPPSQFIYDHFPEDAQWQLLEEAVSKKEFERLVFLRSEFFNYGLWLGSHSQGEIKAENKVNVSIYAPEDVLLISGLRHADKKASAKLDSYTFCERDGDRYDIFAQFPANGSYLLKAYAKKKDELGEYHEVAEYLVNATGDENSTGFPMAYGKFTEVGAYLYNPMEGKLKAGTPYLFRIRIPGAGNVSVVCGDEWTYLASRAENLFEVNATAAKGDVGVFAKFKGDGWDGLVKYAGD